MKLTETMDSIILASIALLMLAHFLRLLFA